MSQILTSAMKSILFNDIAIINNAVQENPFGAKFGYTIALPALGDRADAKALHDSLQAELGKHLTHASDVQDLAGKVKRGPLPGIIKDEAPGLQLIHLWVPTKDKLDGALRDMTRAKNAAVAQKDGAFELSATAVAKLILGRPDTDPVERGLMNGVRALGTAAAGAIGARAGATAVDWKDRLEKLGKQDVRIEF